MGPKPEVCLSPLLNDVPGVLDGWGSLAGVEVDVYKTLLLLMIETKLKPGAKIREEALTEHFAVSRTVIRKVLVVLEQHGLVELPVNRGAFVAKPAAQDARDVCRSLGLITRYSVEQIQAFEHNRRAGVLAKLKAHTKLQIEAEEQNEHLSIHRYSGEFFMLLVYLAGNLSLSRFFETTMLRLALVISIYHDGRRQAQRGRFQSELRARMEAGDLEGSCKLASEYFRDIEQGLQLEDRTQELDLKQLLLSVRDKPRSA